MPEGRDAVTGSVTMEPREGIVWMRTGALRFSGTSSKLIQVDGGGVCCCGGGC